MVRNCCVYKCSNRSGKGSAVTFHCFPRDEKRLQRWLRNISRMTSTGNPWTPSKNDRVCSAHFLPQDFENIDDYKGYINKRLKTVAVPTVFKTYPPHMQLRSGIKRKRRARKEYHSLSQEDIASTKVLIREVYNDHDYAHARIESSFEATKKRMSTDVLDHDLQQMYETALEVANVAGQMIKEAFVKEKNVDIKMSFADYVTETDKAVEKEVHRLITNKFPSHKFIGEETVSETGAKCELTDDPTWIIDPIDGTSNFVHSVPEVAFSLGVTVNKKTVIGIVYAPVKDEMFTARAGQGSFLNGKKLKVNKSKELKSSLVITEGGNSRDASVLDTKISNIHKIVSNSAGIRCYGSAAINLCYVAAGRADVNYEFGIHVWDFVAGALIAQEAGATVSDTEGGELHLFHRRVLATCSPELTKEVSSLLTQIEMESD